MSCVGITYGYFSNTDDRRFKTTDNVTVVIRSRIFGGDHVFFFKLRLSETAAKTSVGDVSSEIEGYV